MKTSISIIKLINCLSKNIYEGSRQTLRVSNQIDCHIAAISWGQFAGKQRNITARISLRGKICSTPRRFLWYSLESLHPCSIVEDDLK